MYGRAASPLSYYRTAASSGPASHYYVSPFSAVHPLWLRAHISLSLVFRPLSSGGTTHLSHLRTLPRPPFTSYQPPFLCTCPFPFCCLCTKPHRIECPPLALLRWISICPLASLLPVCPFAVTAVSRRLARMRQCPPSRLSLSLPPTDKISLTPPSSSPLNRWDFPSLCGVTPRKV